MAHKIEGNAIKMHVVKPVDSELLVHGSTIIYFFAVMCRVMLVLIILRNSNGNKHSFTCWCFYRECGDVHEAHAIVYFVILFEV